MKRVAGGHDSYCPCCSTGWQSASQSRTNGRAKRLVVSCGNQACSAAIQENSCGLIDQSLFFPFRPAGCHAIRVLFLLQWVAGANERYSQHLSFLEPNASFAQKENAHDRGIHE
jgi:hypothetical protein